MDLARRANAGIELSFLTMDRRDSSTYGNQNVLVDPSGNVAWTYHKAHPVTAWLAAAVAAVLMTAGSLAGRAPPPRGPAGTTPVSRPS